MIRKIIQLILQHKIIAGVLVLAVIGGGYYGSKSIFSNDSVVRYATAQVQKGTLITSVSGSGQVSASDQVDVKPKISDEVVGVYVTAGQEVKSGALLVRLDTNDAQRAVQDTEIALETARVQLEELLEPADELTLLQAENALSKAKTAKQEAENNIIEGYEDTFVAITDAFFDLPTIITGLNNILYSKEIADTEFSVSQGDNATALINSFPSKDYEDVIRLEKFINNAKDSYKIARTAYNENLDNYKNTSRYSEHDAIEALLEETLEVLRAMDETTRNEINMLDFWVDHRSQKDLRIFSKVTEYQSNLKSYSSKINSYLSSLLKIQRSFQDNRQAVVDAEYSIKEKELTLEDLKEGATDLEIRTKKLTIQQKEDALNTAKENLANCYIYAPFDGIVAEASVKKGDSVSSSTKLLTLITKQKIAEITLNEIDIARIKTSQKANITFDAVENLNITGEVVEVDALGTVSQGVVTYGVKIAFDTQDERVKPGMTLSANIITEAKQDVLMVQSSAIKQQGDISYVQVVADNTNIETNLAAANLSGAIIPTSNLRTQQVQIGLFNDTMTEVIDGLKEGDIVITQTITSNSASNQSQQSTGGGALPRGGGMMFMR